MRLSRYTNRTWQNELFPKSHSQTHLGSIIQTIPLLSKTHRLLQFVNLLLNLIDSLKALNFRLTHMVTEY